MKFKFAGNKADATINKLDGILEKLGTNSVSRKRYIRIADALTNTDKIGIVRMVRTEFGVLIENVSESFTNMTGVPRKALEGKYLHHVTGGNRDNDLLLCDQIDAEGAGHKIQEFNGLMLEGLILKEEDGVYTELLYLK